MLSFLLMQSQEAPVMALQIDAREVNRGVVHVRQSIPAKPGKFAIYYPKWIPGEHAPFGTIQSVTALHFQSLGKDLTWRRDPVDMFKFWVNVPAGAATVTITFDSLTEPFNTFAPNLARLKFTRLAMSPALESNKVFVQPAITVPEGWRVATALESKSITGSTHSYKTVSFRDLIDSPLLIGKYSQTLDLGMMEKASIRFKAFFDDAETKLSDSIIKGLNKIPEEFGALFGSKHFRHYDFLVTLSNQGAWDGLEHHESSEDGTGAEDPVNDPVGFGYLFTHEFFHSWNGKYRRPAGLATADFLQPMKGELLWVYEGLTQYYGFVMAARCGLITKDQLGDVIAGYYNMLDTEPARKWRSVAESAVSAQLTYATPGKWTRSLRRPDFYFEGMLVWLEADCIIRSGTGGAKSLDNFCRLFAAGSTGAPSVKPYEAEEIYSLLGKVHSYDWKSFFESRLYQVTPRAPKRGIVMSGYDVAFSGEPSAFKNEWVIGSFTFARCGLAVDDGGSVVDLDPKGAAYAAGLNIGDAISKVGGKPFSRDALHAAMTTSTGTISLSVKVGDKEKVVTVKCKGGPVIPHLKRAAGEDLLSKIASPKT